MAIDQQLEVPAKSFLLTYRRTLITCGLVALITAQQYAAVLLMLVLPPLFFWLIYSAVVAYRKPQKRKWQLTRVAIWLVTIFLVFGVHWLRHHAIRVEADRIALAVENYKKKNGAYPANFEAIGEDSNRLRRESMLFYRFNDGSPSLMYSSSIGPLDRYSYDFQSRSWAYGPD